MLEGLGLGGDVVTPSRASGVYNLMEGMRKRARQLTPGNAACGELFPSLTITADAITPQGAFAQAQATYLQPDPKMVQALVKVLTEKKVRAERKSRSVETALSKTDVMILRLLLPHNASSAPWSSPPSLQRSIAWPTRASLNEVSGIGMVGGELLLGGHRGALLHGSGGAGRVGGGGQAVAAHPHL